MAKENCPHNVFRQRSCDGNASSCNDEWEWWSCEELKKENKTKKIFWRVVTIVVSILTTLIVKKFFD